MSTQYESEINWDLSCASSCFAILLTIDRLRLIIDAPKIVLELSNQERLTKFDLGYCGFSSLRNPSTRLDAMTSSSAVLSLSARRCWSNSSSRFLFVNCRLAYYE